MRRVVASLLAALVAVGCGSAEEGQRSPPQVVDPPRPPIDPPGAVAPPWWATAVKIPLPEPEPEPDPIWQPAFHQALRWSEEIGGRTTYRLKVPVGRAGTRLRFAFRTGDGNGRLHGATVALAGENGALASEPVALRFDGASGFSAPARTRVESDPIDFPVEAQDELYVSFEVDGRFAAGAIDLFPDSWRAAGNHVAAERVATEPAQRALALASILALGPAGRAFVVIGDSISEAYVSGRDDYRRSWPALAEAALGVPMANAAVSGQGVAEAAEHLPGEVLALPGVTDCLLMIGTNNIWNRDEHEIAAMLEGLFGELRPFCTVWAGTLPPKDRPEIGPELRRRRQAVNAWLRNEADVAGLVDFEAVLRRPGEPDLWQPGYDEDGVHPSVQGQAVMAAEAARVLAPDL